MFLISLTGHSLKGHLEADLEPASAFCRIAFSRDAIPFLLAIMNTRKKLSIFVPKRVPSCTSIQH